MNKTLLKFAMIAALAFAAAGCTQIDTGNVGVESTLGQVKPTAMQPDVYFTMFKKVTEVSAKESAIALEDMKPQTSDKISLTDLDVDIYVQINPATAPTIMTRWPGDLVKVDGEDGVRVGNSYVTRQAREAIYNAVSKYSSNIVHTKRTELASDIVAMLQKDLDASAGKEMFFVRSANVRNLVTDPALQASIKEAATRDFQIAAKEKEVILARAEADRKRVEAQGDADVIKLRASAIAANGGAEYVQLEAIKKWNGVLPTTQAGGVTPFIHVK